MFKFKVLIIIMFFALTGCKQPTAGDISKPNKPQYEPIVVIQNPTSTQTVYDSTTIQVYVFFRGNRTVSLFVDGVSTQSVDSDTLKYNWIVKDFPKYSKHTIFVETSKGDHDSSSSYAASVVTVSHSMLAFSSNKNGIFQIYIMNDNGTQVRQMTNTATDALYPAWSPIGDKIAYIVNKYNNNAIYIYNLIDSTTTKFIDADSTECLQDLVWSSEYNYLAFVSNGKIVTVNADKTNKKVQVSGFLYRHPSISKSNDIFFDYGINESYLAAVDSAGNLGGVDAGSSNSGKLIIPIQRPSSNNMYIYRKNTKELGYGLLNKTGTNWSMGNISFLPIADVDTTAYCFSPNGKKIAYVSQLDKEIYIINYNGGTPKKISQSSINQSPSWSKK
jgi:hypothetical protein